MLIAGLSPAFRLAANNTRILSQLYASRLYIEGSSVRKMSRSTPPKVFITRRVPDQGPALLKSECTVTQWDSDEPISREELLSKVQGVDGLFCLLTEKIDAELLDAAGEFKEH